MLTTIWTLTSSGEGVGELPSGKTLFVEGALPGERVEVALTEEKKRFAKGKIARLITPSPHRLHPPCPLFGVCGGCHIQHLAYEEQLKFKQQRVQDALKRLAHLDVEVKPCLPSPMPYGYRNKIQLPQQDGVIGLYKKKSHTIIPVERCLIHCAQGEEIYRWVKQRLVPSIRTVLIRNAIFTNEALVIFISDGSEDLRALADALFSRFPEVKGVIHNLNTSKTNRILGKKFRTLIGHPYLTEEIAGKRFKIAAPSFFQVNSWQAASLFSEATHRILGKRVIDAFCGVGTLALFAADRAETVLGIETVPEAIANARENAALNSITNCRFEVGAAETRSLDCDTLLLNPPRKGCNPKLFEKIRANRIVYISCDPATLARDLTHFPPKAISDIQPIDLFPQTTHVETVVTVDLEK